VYITEPALAPVTALVLAEVVSDVTVKLSAVVVLPA